MSRKSRQIDADDGQATQPRPVDADGRELDRFGLPLTGPARIARLAAMGLPDPVEDPDGFAAGDASAPAPTNEEH